MRSPHEKRLDDAIAAIGRVSNCGPQPIECITCRRLLHYEEQNWSWLRPKVAECDECWQKRFAVMHPGAVKLRERGAQ